MPQPDPAAKPAHFALAEFSCKCGCGLCHPSPELLELLDQARKLSGQPYVLTSACRCEKHNRDVGGTPTSSHLAGVAVDIAVASDRQRGAILYGLISAGFRRLGVGKTFIHADLDPGKSGAVWVY